MSSLKSRVLVSVVGVPLLLWVVLGAPTIVMMVTSLFIFSLSEVAKISISASVSGCILAPKLGRLIPQKVSPAFQSSPAAEQTSEISVRATTDLSNAGEISLIASAVS